MVSGRVCVPARVGLFSLLVAVRDAPSCRPKARRCYQPVIGCDLRPSFPALWGVASEWGVPLSLSTRCGVPMVPHR